MASADEKLSGLAFKVAADPYIGTLTFYRSLDELDSGLQHASRAKKVLKRWLRPVKRVGISGLRHLFGQGEGW